MSFEQLRHVTKLGGKGYEYFLLVHEWDTKRQHLAVYLRDIPRLVEEYCEREKKPYEGDPRITVQDPYPTLRLSSACEAAANCLYGMAEIASQFANKASQGVIPSSFNQIRKKLERKESELDVLAAWIGNLDWYKRVRELRTEWVHFSTVFLGEEKSTKQPCLHIRCLRRPSDREMFPKEITVTIDELLGWIDSAITTIDNIGNYVLAQYVLPRLDVDAKVIVPLRDKNGWPLFKEGEFRCQIEEITIREYVARAGVFVEVNH
jgi:hypothetical protein